MDGDIRFKDSPELFGVGIGASTECEVKCEICGSLHNEGEKPEGPSNGYSIRYTEFAGMTVCECCFARIESSVWNRREEIAEWLREIVTERKKQVEHLDRLLRPIDDESECKCSNDDEVAKRKAVTITRKRFIEEVNDWKNSGKSVDQLIFRLSTCHVNTEE